MTASERPTLPVKEAYRFGSEIGLQKEVDEIRNMEVEWDKSYNTNVRRGYIVELFQSKDCFDRFKETYWQYGNTPSGISLTALFLRIRQQYEDFQNKIRGELISDEIAEPEESRSFAAENDLRNFLEKNLDCIEKGLKLYESDGRPGVEFNIDGGRIDLLALDANNDFVVVELKLEKGRNKTIGQLLYYMGWVDENLAKNPCRGIIIAKDISEDLILAVRRVSGVSLCRYNLSVSIEQIPLKKI